MEELDGDNRVLLRARGITKQFGERKVLDNIDLEIKQGQILTLIGPNGAGKTTLVRITLGLLSADSGSISQRRNLRVGYMPQRLHIKPTLPLTVARFLRLGGHQNDAVIADCLKKLHVPHLVDQQMVEISGGELQRVLLARALLRKPELLILDEPAQGVDVAGQAELYALIDEISAEQDCGVLMISHDLHLVMSATDEVICLNHHVCCHGKPEQVSNDPAYLDLFGARTAENIAVYTHNHTHEHDIAGAVIPEEGKD